MITLAEIDALAAEDGLTAIGAAPLTAEERAADALLADLASVVLLGPRQPEFWRRYSASPEAGDGAADPIDRWSRRVGDALAARLGATALYPFGGPPYRPFYSWALRTGRAWPSPISLLVGAEAGLWVSFRLALGFPFEIVSPPVRQPCVICAERPCATACPVDAFAGGAYDVDRCRAHCASPEGADCVALGCRARRSCPAGRAATPPPAQAALHMSAFLGVRDRRE